MHCNSCLDLGENVGRVFRTFYHFIYDVAYKGSHENTLYFSQCVKHFTFEAIHSKAGTKLQTVKKLLVAHIERD